MSLSEFELKDRVAIVTGGGSGIGRGIALVLAKAGADVVIAEKEKNSAEAVATEIKSLKRKSLPLQIDVTIPEQVTNMVKTALMNFKHIDILVNNVGGNLLPPKSPDDTVSPQPNLSVLNMTDEFWDMHIKLNLTSTFLCSREVGRIMAEQGYGNIINISSVAGNRPAAGMAAYGTTKAAVIHFTQNLALELARFNIRVNCIAPQAILRTNQTGEMSINYDEKELIREKGISIGRAGRVEDVGLTALFLASDASAYITGEVINVSGGPLFPTNMQSAFEAQYSD